MFEILKSYINNEKFYIIIMENSFYVKNYNKIININSEEVLLEIDNHIYKFTGKDICLTKSLNKELEIKGIIESISKL